RVALYFRITPIRVEVVMGEEKGRALMVRRTVVRLGMAGAMLASVPAISAHAAETRTYVVGWFSQATYSQETDCPGGENPDITKQWLKDLADLGYTPQQIQELAG